MKNNNKVDLHLWRKISTNKKLNKVFKNSFTDKISTKTKQIAQKTKTDTFDQISQDKAAKLKSND